MKIGASVKKAKKLYKIPLYFVYCCILIFKYIAILKRIDDVYT